MIPEGKERDCEEEKRQSYFLIHSGSAKTPGLGVLLNVELPQQTAGIAYLKHNLLHTSMEPKAHLVP